MTSIGTFPDRGLNYRVAARLTGQSKIGTTEEYAAKRRAALGEVVLIDRRSALIGISTALAGSAVFSHAADAFANTVTHDPVFAAIEKHRQKIDEINSTEW